MTPSPVGQSGDHFRLARGPVADLDRHATRPSFVRDENRPLIPFPEQRAGRHFQHVRRFPDDDSYVDAIGIAERGARRPVRQPSTTFTCCSSTPGADIFVKPAGSMRRTAASSTVDSPTARSNCPQSRGIFRSAERHPRLTRDLEHLPVHAGVTHAVATKLARCWL